MKNLPKHLLNVDCQSNLHLSKLVCNNGNIDELEIRDEDDNILFSFYLSLGRENYPTISFSTELLTRYIEKEYEVYKAIKSANTTKSVPQIYALFQDYIDANKTLQDVVTRRVEELINAKEIRRRVKKNKITYEEFQELKTRAEAGDVEAIKILQPDKEFLSLKEVSELLGMAKSYLYRLTSQRKIPHYKPMGKTVFFNREEVVQWALSNRVATNEEIEQQAQNYCMKSKENNPKKEKA